MAKQSWHHVWCALRHMGQWRSNGALPLAAPKRTCRQVARALLMVSGTALGADNGMKVTGPFASATLGGVGQPRKSMHVGLSGNFLR